MLSPASFISTHPPPPYAQIPSSRHRELEDVTWVASRSLICLNDNDLVQLRPRYIYRALANGGVPPWMNCLPVQ